MVEINGYPIDCAIEEHQADSEVTKLPVEEGSDVTDHNREKPDVVVLTGTVSDTPIGELVDIRAASSGASGLHEKPSQDAWERLKAIRKARKPVTLKTSLGLYKNMWLESLNAPRTATTGDALEFRATFTQLTYVQNERTTVRVAIPGAAAKVNRGNKPPQIIPGAIQDLTDGVGAGATFLESQIAESLDPNSTRNINDADVYARRRKALRDDQALKNSLGDWHDRGSAHDKELTKQQTEMDRYLSEDRQKAIASSTFH